MKTLGWGESVCTGCFVCLFINPVQSSLCLCLLLYLYIFLDILLCVHSFVLFICFPCLYWHVYLSEYVFMCEFICFPLCVCLCPYMCASIYLSLCASLCVLVYLSLWIYISVRKDDSPFVHLYVAIHLYLSLFRYQCVCLFIYATSCLFI